jgi:DNA topoisomerase-2
MTKQIAQTYQVLDEIAHIRKRTGMYAGSTALQTTKEWVYNVETKKMEQRDLTIIPAFIKIFSEILDNAIDEHRRAPDVLDAIRVELHEDGSISVQDNGRGIPVEIHPQTGKYVAETVFSNLRAGSNFNDDEDQQLIGTNGVGSTLTNVLSTSFKIESADGKKIFRQEFTDGMRKRGEPKVRDHDKHYTKITFTPDYAFFKLKGLDEHHKLRIIKKVVDAAATNPKVKFYIDGERVMTRGFDDYIAMYDEEYVYDETPDWKVGVTKSDGFDQISFVNSVETYQGGTHVTYVVNQIVDAVRAHIEKKHKVKVSPGDVRGHMRVYISANVNRPRFSSQTKENMISPPSEWKTSWTVPDKFIQKLLKTEIVKSILDWVAAKEQAQMMADLRKVNKDVEKVNFRRLDKFADAQERVQRHKCILFLAEGDTLEEHTEVVVARDGLTKVALKDVKVGDLVLTHRNRFRPVLSISPKVIQGIKIKYGGRELVISPEHRLIVYNIQTRQFEEVKGKDLRTDQHKLVRNQCIDAIHARFSVERISNGKFEYRVSAEGIESLDSTAEHRFFVLDTVAMEYRLVPAKELNPSLHLLALRPED